GYRGSPRRVDDPRQRRHRGRPLHPAIHQPLHPRGGRMIPDHLIDKAVRAAGENWVLTFEWEHDKLHAQVHAALEAVAADVWDHGYVDGVESAHDYFNGETKADTPNPYRASETA